MSSAISPGVYANNPYYSQMSIPGMQGGMQGQGNTQPIIVPPPQNPYQGMQGQQGAQGGQQGGMQGQGNTQPIIVPPPQMPNKPKLLNNIKKFFDNPVTDKTIVSINEYENQRQNCQNNLNSLLKGMRISAIIIAILLLIFIVAWVLHLKFTKNKCKKMYNENGEEINTKTEKSGYLKAGNIVFYIFIAIVVVIALIAFINIIRTRKYTKDNSFMFMKSCMENQPLILPAGSDTNAGIVINDPRLVGQGYAGNMSVY